MSDSMTADLADSQSPAMAAWKMRTARMAPIGSTTMPSHLTMEPTLREGLMCLMSGAMTVGPVTTRMDPRMAATRQSHWKI